MEGQRWRMMQLEKAAEERGKMNASNFRGHLLMGARKGEKISWLISLLGAGHFKKTTCTLREGPALPW